MRIAIVDDDRLVCDSLGIILGAQEDIEVVGTGCDGDDAVRLVAEVAPDVLLMDIQMPGRDGIDAAREILGVDCAMGAVPSEVAELGGSAAAKSASSGAGAAPSGLGAGHAPRVVFLTTFADDEYIVSALKLGASGYLIKQDVAAIAPALREVMAGKRVLEGRAIEDVDFGAAGSDVVREGMSTRRPAGFGCLTEREFEVAELIAQGLDNKEIAGRAYMGEGTVRNHISSILAKLQLRNRTQIAIAYLRG